MKLKTIILNNLSFVIILLGAISFFISNLLMKNILKPLDYGKYSIFITFFSIIYFFGFFGAEQSFLRYSSCNKNNIIETQKSHFFYLTMILFFTTFFSTLFFKIEYDYFQINTVLLVVAVASMSGIVMVFHVFRLKKNFVLAQFFSNYWKIILFVSSIYFYFYNGSDVLVNLISFVLCNLILIFIFGLLLIYYTVKFEFNTKLSQNEIKMLIVGFFIATISNTIITFSDRFLIENKFSLTEFGDFFYLTNFFLAPFAILQNYIGFKHLMIFKVKYDKNYLMVVSKKIVTYGIIFSVMLFSLLFILNKYGYVKIDFTKKLSIIILLLLTGIIRLYSSSIISAFEATTTAGMIKESNAYIFILTLMTLIIIYFFVNSIELILISLIIIWLLRCIVHQKILNKHFDPPKNL